MQQLKQVVIVGGGFGGLFAAKQLNRPGLALTVIDRRNFHLFQPLLYQVATGGLSPGDIASPLRAILAKQKNTRVLQDQVVDIDPEARQVVTATGSRISYDYLILATGVRHHYFGNSHWAKDAPGLKTIENALDLRQRILSAFERAELEKDPERRRTLQRFVIVGGGPTGVELAGALGELAHATLRGCFRTLKLEETEIVVLEGSPQVLPGFSAGLATRAKHSLERLGLRVLTSALVTNIEGEEISYTHQGATQHLQAGTVLWAAGVKASPLCAVLARRFGASLDRSGKVVVDEWLNLPGHREVFAIGDMAHYEDEQGKPVPGVAPVAMQQGRSVARQIKAEVAGRPRPRFRYRDKGSLAVIGRNAAVAQVGKLKFWGFPAWLLWALIHIHYLIEFDNKAMVSFQWFWNYLTRKRGALLITDGIQDEEDAPAATPLKG